MEKVLYPRGKTSVWSGYHIDFLSTDKGFFSLQNKPKNLDPSSKMDLGLWDCLGKVKLTL